MVSAKLTSKMLFFNYTAIKKFKFRKCVDRLDHKYFHRL